MNKSINVKFKNWWQYLNPWQWKHKRIVETFVNETLTNSKEEMDKVVQDTFIYGQGFYRMDKDGKILHVPYQEAIKGKK